MGLAICFLALLVLSCLNEGKSTAYNDWWIQSELAAKKHKLKYFAVCLVISKGNRLSLTKEECFRVTLAWQAYAKVKQVQVPWVSD